MGTHIWQYDSLEHRAKVRAALGQDPDWVSQYVSKLLPCLESQVNQVCVATPGVEQKMLSTASEAKGGVFQMVTVPKDSENFSEYIQAIENGTSGRLLSSLDTVVGPKDRNLLFRYDKVD